MSWEERSERQPQFTGSDALAMRQASQPLAAATRRVVQQHASGVDLAFDPTIE
jgi:hypothetical protein